MGIRCCSLSRLYSHYSKPRASDSPIIAAGVQCFVSNLPSTITVREYTKLNETNRDKNERKSDRT